MVPPLSDGLNAIPVLKDNAPLGAFACAISGVRIGWQVEVCGANCYLCQAQQFAHTREAPKSICETEGGRTKWGGRLNLHVRPSVDRGASHARATAKFEFFVQRWDLFGSI